MSPVLVAPETGWPLHDAAASRAAEAAALAGAPPHALMRRAGLGVARLALALAPHARTVAVLAGPGNNGGDGLVAARHLHAAGKAVRVVLAGDSGRLPADAADALAAAQAAGVPIAQALDEAPAELVIDALLGLGTRRAPEGRIAAAIDWAATRRAPVLAVDLPSGLHPDTGQPLGETCLRADATLALLTLKPGLFTGHGRDHAGQVWFDDLGVAAGGETARLTGAPPGPVRHHAQHKGSFGDLAVVGGAPGMAGAAWLAARAALAAGAGRVYCSLLDANAPLLDAARPELMGCPAWWRSPPATLAAATVVAGCGGGQAVREALPALLAHAGRLVLDADALNVLAADPSLQRLLTHRSRPTVLTPHPLEAARLLGTTAAAVQADRVAAAQRLAERLGCVVVLKGSGSVVAAPGALPSLNPTGNALLATAGTGDVLAGWLGGRWAAGGEAFDSAVAAAWQHGHAADRAQAAGARAPLRAADLVEALHAAA
ncbi:NAD(P)H-hydrate dehydratase [Rubrivivax sp. JA1029]|uniref:NAD(P)H-hydrate dehydratase n=1 Tax=Rubrivivax sp. JA1029 TaxID=2894193 RepID=UPI001E615B79|nr:NAD(P)H-hydrate dehydratase [Rubrivivax sp. JA1029]MCC9646141.1 NAD(P)H-hydrate dehydratase [Rubrivivax sp. JA1029]